MSRVEAIAPSSSPFDQVLAREESALLERVVAELSERERDVLLAYFVHEKTLREIATSEGLSVERIRQIKDKALRTIWCHPATRCVWSEEPFCDDAFIKAAVAANGPISRSDLYNLAAQRESRRCLLLSEVIEIERGVQRLLAQMDISVECSACGGHWTLTATCPFDRTSGGRLVSGGFHSEPRRMTLGVRRYLDRTRRYFPAIRHN